MTLTPAAAERIRALMSSKGDAVAGLKIGVKKGGCAGMEYTMTWASEIDRLDEVIEADGARVIIEPARACSWSLQPASRPRGNDQPSFAIFPGVEAIR
jgi:iron-sulfur cluster assembly accessory protein